MISICIATYNGARYIAEQLASILKQLSAEDEVVVSDDGSTDGTLD
ncbi:glycosyltransferase, partial [Leyella stercorea]